MNNWDFSNFGEKVDTMIKDAFDKMDFENMSKDIGDTIHKSVEDITSSAAANINDRFSQGTGQRRHKSQPFNPVPQQNKSGAVNTSTRYTTQVQKRFFKKTGGDRMSALLMSCIGTAFSAFSAVGMLLYMGMFIDRATTIGAIFALYSIALPVFIVSTAAAVKGVRKYRMISRFKEYVGILNGRSYCTIEELAKGIRRPASFVVNDLKKMINARLFREGYIDDQATSLMLGRDIYDQYLLARQNYESRKLEEQRQKEGSSLDEEIDVMIRNGRDCIRQIRLANEAIPGPEISAKMYRLESVISNIFDHVEEHPEQVSSIHKFMDYYLPTTLKLVKTYEKLDGQNVSSENIEAAKDEIEKTLDTINTAFEHLYNDLFADIALDISTDISALKSVLSQEGLTDHDFKIK